MKRTMTTLVNIGLILIFSAQVWADGRQVVIRAGGNAISVAPGATHSYLGRCANHLTPGHFHLYQPFYFPYVYCYQSFESPVIVISPYFYPHQVAITRVVNAPFYCLLHHVGYVSRIGMLDHLAGAHKFALETAGIICPPGAAHCLFPSTY